MILLLLAGVLPGLIAVGIGLATVPAVWHGGAIAAAAGLACALLTGMLLRHQHVAALLAAIAVGLFIRVGAMATTVIIARQFDGPHWRWATVAAGTAALLALAAESALVYRRLVVTKPPARDSSP